MRLIRFFVGAFKGNYGLLFQSSEVEKDQYCFKRIREISLVLLAFHHFQQADKIVQILIKMGK
jgi:hypothetical protein